MITSNSLKIGFAFLAFIATSWGCSSNEKDADQQVESMAVPNYLSKYADMYRDDPREANLQWFKDAKYGLFMHYGLYALLEQGEWVQLRHDPPIPVSDYDTLKDIFTAEHFDADFITDFVQNAGMKYITITSKHHDGYCLWDTEYTTFKSTNSPCGRDLIGELAEACDRKGVGLFLYYSYAADWKHPYFYDREEGWGASRPAYNEPQPEYRYQKPEDFKIYETYVRNQVRELLTRYPTIAGIWFDPIMGFYSRPDLFDVEGTYEMIREMSPHALISFKQGATGTEDFMAPERGGGARVGEQYEVARKVYELNQGKPTEICNTMQPHLPGFHGGSTWGYNKHLDGKHLNADQVMGLLANADSIGANLLLNIGPKPDGSFPQEDIDALLEVGRRLKNQ
jgi:alpha-L-fucosidase